MKFEIYTDGSAKNNGKKNAVGGWGFALWVDGKLKLEGSEGVKGATNQQMELMAAIKALESIDDVLLRWGCPIHLYSDSAYLINCFKQKWYLNWEQNGWVNSKKEPVANQELWEMLIPYFNNPRIDWHKVKGHANNEKNNYVDELAQTAAARVLEELKC